MKTLKIGSGGERGGCSESCCTSGRGRREVLDGTGLEGRSGTQRKVVLDHLEMVQLSQGINNKKREKCAIQV